MFSSVYTSSKEQKVVFLVLLYAIVKCAPITEQSGKIQKKKLYIVGNPSKNVQTTSSNFLRFQSSVRLIEVGLG